MSDFTIKEMLTMQKELQEHKIGPIIGHIKLQRSSGNNQISKI